MLTIPRYASPSLFNNMRVWVPLILILDLLILFIPFHLFFLQYHFSMQESKEMGNILHGIIRISFVVFLIRKWNLQGFICFHPFKVVNLPYLLIPLVFPLPLAIPNFSGVPMDDFIMPSVMVACLSLFLMAAAEEFLIRGLILSAFLKKYGAQNMIRAVLVSAILFSVMHLVNLFRMNMAEVFIQMIIAFFFGVFFGALMMKTKNLFYLSIIHGVINICFSLDAVLRKTSVKKTVDSWQEILAAIGTTTLILSPLFIIGFLILRKMKKEQERNHTAIKMVIHNNGNADL